MTPEVQAQRVIRLFYAFQVTFSLLLWMPIFYDYQRTMGLTDPQIFTIQSAYYISFCFLEIPTGFLADRFGYRRTMLYGATLHVVTSLLPAIWFTFAGFLTHWILLAISRSLVSGASSAYLYNYLEGLGQLSLYKDAEGKARAYSLGAKVAGFAACGYMMKLYISMPYLMTAFSSVLAIIAVTRMPPLAFEASAAADKPAPPRATQVLALLGKNPRLVLLMVQGVGIFVLTRIVQVNLFQPILQDKGFSREGFGLILALNTLFEALGSSQPQLLRRWSSDFVAVFWLTLALALCCLMLGPSTAWGAVFWLTLFAVLAGLAYPIQRQVLNQAIPDSRYRASLLSAESVIDRALCAVVAQQLGSYVADHHMNQYLTAAGYVTIGAGLLLTVIFFALRPASKPPSS